MLKAIIIDDEPQCIETLQLMLEKKFTNEVQLAGHKTRDHRNHRKQQPPLARQRHGRPTK